MSQHHCRTEHHAYWIHYPLTFEKKKAYNTISNFETHQKTIDMNVLNVFEKQTDLGCQVHSRATLRIMPGVFMTMRKRKNKHDKKKKKNKHDKKE